MMIRIAWFDDEFAENIEDETRQRQLQNLRNATRDRASFSTHGPAEWASWIKGSFGHQKPDLILVDYRLKSAGVPESQPFEHGETLIAAMGGNSELADVPKYLVSRVFDGQPTLLSRKDYRFDRIIPASKLDTGAEELLHDAESYCAVRNAFLPKVTAERIELLLDALSVPSEANLVIKEVVRSAYLRMTNRLVSTALPGGAESGNPNVLEFAKWIRFDLLVRNGPLVSDCMAATLLGFRDDAFLSHSSIAELREGGNQYCGAFCASAERRWWRSGVVNWLLNRFNDLSYGSISEFAERVANRLEIPEADRAVCAVCKQLWPDTVAYDEADASEIRQVHVRCSAPDKNIEALEGFDVVRCFVN